MGNRLNWTVRPIQPIIPFPAVILWPNRVQSSQQLIGIKKVQPSSNIILTTAFTGELFDLSAVCRHQCDEYPGLLLLHILVYVLSRRAVWVCLWVDYDTYSLSLSTKSTNLSESTIINSSLMLPVILVIPYFENALILRWTTLCGECSN